jgi:hypothetical protein
MEFLGNLLFGGLLAAAWYALCLGLNRLFALLPLPHWLRTSLNMVISFSSALLLVMIFLKLLAHDFRLRDALKEEPNQWGVLLFAWVVTVLACGIASGIYLLIAPWHLPVTQQQLCVGVPGVSFWFLVTSAATRWLERRATESTR